MHGVIGEVDEEGGARFLLDELQDFIGQSIGEVVAARVAVRILSKPERIRKDDLVEPLPTGRDRATPSPPEIPHAEEGRGITPVPERLGQGHRLGGEFRGIAGGQESLPGPARLLIRVDHGVDPVPGGVLARHQAGPRGGAVGGVGVGAGEMQATPGKAVEMWRLDEPVPRAAQVAPTHVVHQHDDDIGRPGLDRAREAQSTGQGEQPGEGGPPGGGLGEPPRNARVSWAHGGLCRSSGNGDVRKSRRASARPRSNQRRLSTAPRGSPGPG